MWIFMNDAYFSIVHKDCAPDELLVRARRKGDIERVFKVKSSDVTSVDHADYQYRAVFLRTYVAARLSDYCIFDIKYPNFKNSVKDYALARMYSHIWEIAGGAKRMMSLTKHMADAQEWWRRRK